MIGGLVGAIGIDMQKNIVNFTVYIKRVFTSNIPL